MKRSLLWGWGLCVSSLAWAQLPATEAVAPQLLAVPEVQAAEAGLRASQAAAERAQVGPHEFTLRLAAQQRRVRDAATRGVEPQVSLERAVRWPGKAAQDQAVAEAGLALARLQRADALHEASRTLLRDWYALQNAQAVAALWQAQHGSQAALVETSRRRVQAGDAARSELAGLQAALAQMEASRLQAQARLDAALASWAARYPLLPAPAVTEADEWPCAAPVPDRAALLARLVNDDHGVRMAQAEAQQARAQAERAALERRADPTLGLHLAREQAGNERLLGVSISLPLGGAGRAADGRQAQAHAEALAAVAEQRRRERLGDAASQAVMATAALQTWQAQAAAEAQASAALQAAQRGWALGEYAVGEVHQARRQQAEAALAALSARLDALHLQARLQLDLHQLWDLGDD
jgi:cobalt-zinc-cadmium efflux system outer membrane protein